MDTTLDMKMKPVTGREIAALLNPRLAALVTCCDREGRPNALTVAWHTPLSHRPPLLGIAIAPTRYSHRLLRETGEFVFHVVGQGLLQAVRICGKYTGELDDKLAIAGLAACPAETVRPPRLAGALGVLECRVVEQIETGDHTLFVGEVLAARARAGCFSDAWENANGEGVLQCLQKDRYATFQDCDGNGRS